MARKRKITISNDEKELLIATRNSVFGPEVPYGVVVDRACRALLAERDE